MKIFLVLLGACAFIVYKLLKPKQVVPVQPQTRTQDARDGTCGYC